MSLTKRPTYCLKIVNNKYWPLVALYCCMYLQIVRLWRVGKFKLFSMTWCFAVWPRPWGWRRESWDDPPYRTRCAPGYYGVRRAGLFYRLHLINLTDTRIYIHIEVYVKPHHVDTATPTPTGVSCSCRREFFFSGIRPPAEGRWRTVRRLPWYSRLHSNSTKERRHTQAFKTRLDPVCSIAENEMEETRCSKNVSVLPKDRTKTRPSDRYYRCNMMLKTIVVVVYHSSS